MSDLTTTRERNAGSDAPPPRGPSRWAALRNFRHGALVVALIPSVLIVALMIGAFWLSFRSESAAQLAEGPYTFQHYIGLYVDRFVIAAARNTVIFAGASILWALLFGVSMAWLVERTDLGGRRIVYALVTIGVLTPNFFTAMSWVYLLQPRIGTLNVWLRSVTGNDDLAINVMSLGGMGWVQGLSLAPLVFILLASSIGNMDASLEEAAQVHGARFGQTIRKITLPISKAALLGAALYITANAISTFDVPVIIGIASGNYVFSTYLYAQIERADEVARYGMAAAFATVMIVIAIFWSWWYTRVIARARRFEVITGKSFKPKIIELGKWRPFARLWVGGFLFIAIVLPILVLIWVSLLPYLQPVTLEAFGNLSFDNYRNMPWHLVRRGVKNTLFLMLGAPTVAMALSLLFSWLVLRSEYRYRRFFDYIAFLPHAVPNVIFGFAAFLIVLYYPLPGWFDLHGSVRLLFILYVLTMLSFGTRITNAALIQVHRELEESARLSGARTLTMVRRIIGPLLRPALMMGWIWLAMVALRELTMAAVLQHPNNMTLPVVIWQRWASGGQTQAAAMTVIMMALMVPLVVLYFTKFGGTLWHSNPARPQAADDADDGEGTGKVAAAAPAAPSAGVP